MIVSLRKSPIYRFSLYILIVLILFALIRITTTDTERVAFGDSVQYWATARLMLAGSNPYSPEQVMELRHQVGVILSLIGSPGAFLELGLLNAQPIVAQRAIMF